MFSSTFVQSFILAAALVGSASAHGFVESVILDGKTYTGPKPLEQGGAPLSGSPVRIVQANGPAGAVNSAGVACGLNQKAALITAPVTAGSKVTIQWSPSWPHQVGPILTYLGKCSGNCEDTDPTKINFFKVHEAKFVSGTTQWIQDTTLKAGKPFTFTLPAVPSGKYIMRHEVIALHRATEANGAEFYPSCIQVDVKGGSGSIPSSTVKFPGAYSATDPGIKVDVFSGSIAGYVMPGPAITLGGGDDDSGDDGSDDTVTSDVVESTTSASSTKASSTAKATTTAKAVVSTTSSSTRRGSVATSSAAVAVPTGSTGGSKPFTRQNGLDAIALNEKFKTIKPTDACTDSDIGCVGDKFAQCVGGKWLLTQCSAPTICAALPLVNKPGTSIACTTAEDRDSRIALTGALRLKKMHKRNGFPHHVVGSV